jgi:ketosteroid isomerase-like protein
MLKLSEMNRVIIVYLVLLVSACQQPEDTSVLREEVLETDRSFNKMATEKGIAEAFIYYADEKVIKPSAGQQPIVGKYALIQSYNENPPTYSLTWDPIRAEASGTLGYTFGGYTLMLKNSAGRDTTVYGNYVSIWKRKNDGSWRYVLDAGNPTPGPVVFKK